MGISMMKFAVHIPECHRKKESERMKSSNVVWLEFSGTESPKLCLTENQA